MIKAASAMILSVMVITASAASTRITDAAAYFQHPIKSTVSFHEVSSNTFKLLIPKDWKAEITPDGDILFGKETEDDAGEIYRKRLRFLEGESILTENILHRMLPNHLAINSKRELDGFFTDAYLLNATMIAPPPQGGQFIGNWTYIIFVDYKKSSGRQILAYGLSLNTKYASEQEAIDIAETISIK